MNHFFIDEPTCISFSGGRTSAYMLWRVLQAHGGKLPPEATVCFANTGKEDEATLRFVRDCGQHWGVEIVWLEYRDNAQKFERVTFETASRNGEPFESIIKKRGMLPNTRARFCTAELKIRTVRRYLQSTGLNEWQQFIGIRADEQRRLAKLTPDYIGEEVVAPLGKAGITKQNVLQFWHSNSFDLELPVIDGETIGGNCDLCFLKSIGKIKSLIAVKPERAIWWAKMESLAQTMTDGDGNVFRIDRPRYADLASFVERQGDFFGHQESIECFCGD